MPAYTAVCYEIDESPGDVFFVDHPIEARRRMADMYQDGELGGITVQRERSLDQYEAGPGIPMVDMLELGWWSECSHCGELLTWGNLEDRGKDPTKVVGYFRMHCYCDEKCAATHKKQTARKAALKRKLYGIICAHVEKVYGVGVVEFRPEEFHLYAIPHADGWIYRSVSFHFKFPGQQHGTCQYRLDSDMAVTQHPEDVPKLMKLTVPRGDIWDFHKFHYDKTGIVLDMPDRNA